MSSNIEFEKLNERKNNFYREQFRRMVMIMIFLLLTAGFLLLVLFAVNWAQSAPKYYASTTNGNVIRIQSLSEPVVTQKFVIQWSELVARSAYTFDFLNSEKQLKATSKYFTPEGWQAFETAVKDSGYLEKVQQDKLQVSTVVNGSPVVAKRYISHGHYTWVVQMPLLVLYTSANMNVKRQLYVTMTVKRVPEMEIAQGIAVTDFSVHGG